MNLYSLLGTYSKKECHGFNMLQLRVHQAYLYTTLLDNTTYNFIFERHRQCVKCPYYSKMGVINNHARYKLSTHIHYKVVSSREKAFLIESDKRDVIFDFEDKIGEFGIYHLKVARNNCALETIQEPVNIYLPILTIFLIYLTLLTLIILFKSILKKTNFTKNVFGEEIKENNTLNPAKQRIRSLDTFRGFTLVAMVFVNYGSGEYSWLKHVVWYGLHVADLMFPWFLWIMGVCVPMAIRSRIKRGDHVLNGLWQILKRSCILFFLGIFINGSASLIDFRICGILQRISICYLVHSTLCFLTMKREENRVTSGYRSYIADIALIKYSWVTMLIVWLLHSGVTYLVPFPGCPSGYLGPGGIHENRKYYNCTGGIAAYIDSKILGQHIFHYGRSKEIFLSKHFEHEGLLGTFVALVHVCFGVQAGATLLTYKDHKNRITRWCIWGTILALAGGILCDFSFSDGIIPLVKHLWTTSFMFITVGLAFLLFTLCYVLVDMWKIWSGKPIIFLGMNSITIYVGHYLVKERFPFSWYVHSYETHFTKLLEDVTGTALWILIAYLLHKNNIFIKL